MIITSAQKIRVKIANVGINQLMAVVIATKIAMMIIVAQLINAICQLANVHLQRKNVPMKTNVQPIIVSQKLVFASIVMTR